MVAQKDCIDSRPNLSRRDAMRILLTGGTLASPAGGLLAHAASSSSPVPKQGGRIKAAGVSGSTTDTLDPANGSGATDYTRAYMFYNGLTRLDEKPLPQMELAESIANEGALRWTIKLRKDVQFHDGKPFTSADVVYSLLRHKNPAIRSKVQSVAEQMAEVKATSPHEVESGWKNEKFEQLLIAARAQTDEAKRKRLYADMQGLVHEHCGIGIPMFKVIVDGYHTSIKGYGAHPLGGFMGFMFAEQVWLEA